MNEFEILLLNSKDLLDSHKKSQGQTEQAIELVKKSLEHIEGLKELIKMQDELIQEYKSILGKLSKSII